MAASIHIGFLIYPGVTQLDATGPAQVLSLVPGAIIHMVSASIGPVATDAGFSILPTDSYESCPPLDVLCVPGGPGQRALMQDASTLQFLRDQGAQARYITSVCSGALLLGAAGLLQGYRSTSHWAYRDLLKNFGAEAVAQRVVRDRNRFSGGGVTAGIDFGLTLAAELAGEQAAREIQLYLEYDPQPPFSAGNPDSAGPETTERVRARLA